MTLLVSVAEKLKADQRGHLLALRELALVSQGLQVCPWKPADVTAHILTLGTRHGRGQSQHVDFTISTVMILVTLVWNYLVLSWFVPRCLINNQMSYTK